MNTTESNEVSSLCPDFEDEDLFGIFPAQERETGEEEVEIIINITDDEAVLEQEHGQNFQSSNAKHIAFVIGVNDIVVRFDNLRAQLKTQ